MVDLPKRRELAWVKEDAGVWDLTWVEGCLGRLQYSAELWLVIEYPCGSAYGADDLLGAPGKQSWR
jgi:hypothetical protein